MNIVILAILSLILTLGWYSWSRSQIHLIQTWSIKSSFIALSPDGQLLAAPSGPPQERKIGILPVTSGTTLKLYTFPDEELVHTLNVFYVTEFAFSPDSSLIAAGTGLGEIFIWRTKDGQLLHSLKVKVSQSNPRMLSVNTLIFTPDGQTLITGVGDNIDVWRVADGQRRYRLSQKWSYGDISPDGEILAIGGSVDKITLYRLQDGTRLRQLKVNGDPHFSADGQLLAITYSTSYRNDYWEKVFLYRLEDDTVLGALPGLKSHVNDLTFSPDGRYLAATYSTGGYQGSVLIIPDFNFPGRDHLALWRLDNLSSDKYSAPLVFSSQKIALSTLAFSPDGKTLVSGGGAIRLWRVPD